jgi:nitrate reductase gamma subunit
MMTFTDTLILILLLWTALVGSFTIPMVVKAIQADSPTKSDLTPQGEGARLQEFGR